MHSIKLNIQDSIFDKVIFFLNNLPKNEVVIVENKIINQSVLDLDYFEVKSFSNHTANIIEEWKDTTEDEVWK